MPSQATTAELQASIDRKLAKFGSLERIPPATRVLVENGMAEVKRRVQKEQSSDRQRNAVG
jgi:hypothetical protein